MKPVKIRRWTILEVHWTDAAGSSKWEPEDQTLNDDPEYPVISVGYLWGTSKRDLHLASSHSRSTVYPRMVSQTQSIPWPMITKIRRVGMQGK